MIYTGCINSVLYPKMLLFSYDAAVKMLMILLKDTFSITNLLKKLVIKKNKILKTFMGGG